MGQLNLRVLIQAVDRASGPIRKVVRALKIDLPSATRVAGGALRSLTGLARRAGQALGALAGLSFAAITGGAIRTGAKFEQFGAVLETIEGSAEKARAAMRWVEEFAKTTPYELDEVMEAFVALRAYGIDPTDGSLRTLGDAASAMNKPLMQAVEMLADAQTGEFERMKEFGVRGSAAGNQVAMTYQRAGREVTATSRKSANEIRRNLLGIFDSRFAGAMARQSGTMKGLWSNLMDMATSFQRQIADAGLFAFVKAELAGLLAQVNAAAANGKLEAWAKQISEGLVQLLTSLKALVTEVDWVGFTKAIIAAANGFAQFMQWIGGFEGLVTIGVGGAIGWLTTALMGLGVTIAGILGVAAAPIAAVIAAIGLIGLAAWFLYRNWQEIWAGLVKGWNDFVSALGGIWTNIKKAFVDGAALVWNALPAWFRVVLRGGAFAVRMISRIAADRPAGGGGGPPSMPAPAVGAARDRQDQLNVNLTLRGGQAALAGVRSTNPNHTVNTQYRGGYGD